MFHYAAPSDDDSADVVLLASDGTGFRAHRSMLQHASASFAAIVPDEVVASSEPLESDDLDAVPVVVTVQLVDSAATLRVLLRFCYPMADPVFPTMEVLASVMSAAFKYELKRAQAACTNALMSPDMLKEFPFDVYAVAHLNKLGRETRLAARNTLKYKVHWASPMPLQLGSTTGSAVYELLRYREQCRSSALDAMRDSIWWDTLGDVQYYPCFACDPDAEENESTKHYSLQVEDCLRITHRLLSIHPCGSDILREKILANIIVLAPFHDGFMGSCDSGDCRERVVTALIGVHQEVMGEIDRAIRDIELHIKF